MTKTTLRVTPSRLTEAMVNMGYNRELSAPMIANTYLEHKSNGTPLSATWEKSTIKDVQTMYNKILNER